MVYEVQGVAIDKVDYGCFFKVERSIVAIVALWQLELVS